MSSVTLMEGPSLGPSFLPEIRKVSCSNIWILRPACIPQGDLRPGVQDPSEANAPPLLSVSQSILAPSTPCPRDLGGLTSPLPNRQPLTPAWSILGGRRQAWHCPGWRMPCRRAWPRWRAAGPAVRGPRNRRGRPRRRRGPGARGACMRPSQVRGWGAGGGDHGALGLGEAYH